MTYIKLLLQWILKIIQASETVICIIGLLAICFLVFGTVLNRHLLHFGIGWFTDLAVYTFIFFMLIAAALATWREGHIAVDFFHQKTLKGKPRAIALHRVSIVLITIVAVSVFFPQAYKFMLRALKYPEYGTLVPWVNQSYLQSTLFFAAALILLHLLVIIARDISGLIKNWRPNSQE